MYGTRKTKTFCGNPIIEVERWKKQHKARETAEERAAWVE